METEHIDGPPRRPLDTATREGLGDLIAEASPGRRLIKSRDFSQDLRGPDFSVSDIEVVLYDVYSIDSFAACWVAREALGNKACYEGVDRSMFSGSLVQKIPGKVVALMGLCSSVEVMHDLTWDCSKLLVCDTWASSARQLAEFSVNYRSSSVLIFDSSLGAATMAWNLFFPEKPVPALLRAIEDAELGHYALKDGRSFEDGMEALFGFTRPRGPLHQSHDAFLHFEKLLQDDGGRSTIGTCVEEGLLLQSEIAVQCQEAERRMKVCSLRAFPAWRCAMLHHSSPFEGRVADHLVDVLVKRCPGAPSRCFAVVFEVVAGHRVRVVLRSKPGGPDVSQIAELFEGGGYATRAFFTISLTHWETLWEMPMPVFWDVDMKITGTLQLRRGDLVTISRKGERFKDSPFDEWSFGYKSNEPEKEGWIPTLAHTLFVATRSESSRGSGVQNVQEGDLVIGLGQKGSFLWGWALTQFKDYVSGGPRGWFPYYDDILMPVHSSSVQKYLSLFQSK